MFCRSLIFMNEILSVKQTFQKLQRIFNHQLLPGIIAHIHVVKFQLPTTEYLVKFSRFFRTLSVPGFSSSGPTCFFLSLFFLCLLELCRILAALCFGKSCKKKNNVAVKFGHKSVV